MTFEEKVNGLAGRWLSLCRGGDAAQADLYRSFDEVCADLGIRREYGEAFIREFPEEWESVGAFSRNVARITDVQMLAGALLIRWQQAVPEQELLPAQEDRPWFIAALTRLEKLTRPSKVVSLFGGKEPRKARAERLTMQYQHVRMVRHQKPELEGEECSIWSIFEKLVLDRADGSMGFYREFGSGREVMQQFNIGDDVADLLDSIDPAKTFRTLPEPHAEASGNLDERDEYVLTVEFSGAPNLTCSGAFNRRGVPDDWDAFANKVRRVLCWYGMGDLFLPPVYKKPAKGPRGYMFCSVCFMNSMRDQYYISDDESIEVGDKVLVPLGDEGRTAVGQVADIEYYADHDAPYPLDQVKCVIRRMEEAKHEETYYYRMFCRKLWDGLNAYCDISTESRLKEFRDALGVDLERFAKEAMVHEYAFSIRAGEGKTSAGAEISIGMGRIQVNWENNGFDLGPQADQSPRWTYSISPEGERSQGMCRNSLDNICTLFHVPGAELTIKCPRRYAGE